MGVFFESLDQLGQALRESANISRLGRMNGGSVGSSPLTSTPPAWSASSGRLSGKLESAGVHLAASGTAHARRAVGVLLLNRNPARKPIPAIPHVSAATTSNKLSSSGCLKARGTSTSARRRQIAAIPASVARSKGSRFTRPSAEQPYTAQILIRTAMPAVEAGANHVPACAEATIWGGAPKKAYHDGLP